MVNIGVIGCGTMAQRHLYSYKTMDDVNVVAVCDINDELAHKIGNENGINSYKDYHNLYKNENIDAVDVCIPTIYHHLAVLKALEYEKDVFCEKPLTYKIENIKLIKEKLYQSKRILMTGYLYNFHPSFKRLNVILDENVIGEPYFAIFRIGGRGSRRIWKHKKDFGGGAILEMMVHMLDLASQYFYPYKEIQTMYNSTILKQRLVENTMIEADAEDCVYIRLKSEKGTEIICEADLITPSYMNYVEVHGTNGSFFGSILDDFPTIVFCKEPMGIYDQGRNTFPNQRVDLVKEELNHFIKVIQGVEEPPNSIQKEENILNIIEEIRRQAGVTID